MSLLESVLRRGVGVLNLATIAVDNTHPVNRFVYYVVPETFDGFVYVATMRNSNKVSEIQFNNRVSFTTTPSDQDDSWVGSHTAHAELTNIDINEIAPLFDQQIPGWIETVGTLDADNWAVIKLHIDRAQIVEPSGIVLYPEI
jgi:general stress protein 26